MSTTPCRYVYKCLPVCLQVLAAMSTTPCCCVSRAHTGTKFFVSEQRRSAKFCLCMSPSGAQGGIRSGRCCHWVCGYISKCESCHHFSAVRIRERPFHYLGERAGILCFSRLSFSVDVKAGYFFHTPFESSFFFTKNWKSDFFNSHAW